MRAASDVNGDSSAEMTTTFVVGVVLDLVVIPWPYVYRHFVRAPGARWGATSSARSPAAPSGGGRRGDTWSV